MPILVEDQKIHGTYDVERFLGEGAFAEVYRVNHRFLGRQAIKVFKRVGMTLNDIEEVLGEARLLERIPHPNIVRVYDANVLESPQGVRGYFTMEYVAGGSLDQFWRSYGRIFIPVEETVEIMRQVCGGLSAAHADTPPIIHRDIKPQNILVGYDEDGLRVRVSDFGLAKQVNRLTLVASAAGTLAFKPPETFSSVPADSCAGDVWALGVTLYLLLTDQLPHQIDRELGWSNKKSFEKQPSLPSELNGNVDTSLEEIVLCCLEVNQKNRFPTAKELLAALEVWQRHAPIREGRPKQEPTSEIFKSVLGMRTPIDQKDAQRLVRAAIKIAEEHGRLSEAADIMEEALNGSPALRQKYADKVRLWRSGVSM